MNKLFFSLFLLLPLSLNAMDNPKRLIVAGSSALGLGGIFVGNKLIDHAMREQQWKNRRLTGALHKKADNKCAAKVALGCTLQATSLLAANLLGRYAYSGSVSPNNSQTYISALAIAVGGLTMGGARVGAHLTRGQAPGTLRLSPRNMWYCGALLSALGMVGLHANS